MADTGQVVSWSLERKCDFRAGENWFLPRQTLLQLNDFRSVAKAILDQRVVDRICVMGWTHEQDKAGRRHEVPYSGFRIDDRLGKHGGLTAAVETCGDCEANADNQDGITVAGCYGFLDVWPDSQEFDARLRKVIEHHGLESRLKVAFPVTTPLWYGLWIESPLRMPQTQLLYDLLNAVCNVDKDKDIAHFLNALNAAISGELPVHVSLAPPGHVDLGWHTVFPHCPRCKASTPVARWHDKYPTEPHPCRACGHTYIPNEHHSSKPDDHAWDAPSLEETLGKPAYEEFVKRYLLHRGCTERQAKEVMSLRRR
jgi:hypothetical protein